LKNIYLMGSNKLGKMSKNIKRKLKSFIKLKLIPTKQIK
jgi:hypothetical protein